ncbi:MAG: GDYXXLXY domain-containing protein [Akkermansia sp.]|nr:GDYXXLXY domain-containing protein [Akkermansia sp.]
MNKTLSQTLLSAVVAGQLAWLGYNYYSREEEIAHSPTLTVACDALDPRDLFRGDYVSFDCDFRYPLTDPLFVDLFHWDEEYKPKPNEENNTVTVWLPDMMETRLTVDQIEGIPARAATNPDSLPLSFNSMRYSAGRNHKFAGFWRANEGETAALIRVVKAGSAQDVTQPGELRTVMEYCVIDDVVLQDGKYIVKADVQLSICVSDLNDKNRFRFYVPEKTGDPVKAWFEGLRKENKGYLNDMAFPSDRILTTVDFAVRGRNGLIVKQLYLNDIPWVEAIELMRKGKFPLLEEPIDRNSSFPRFRRIRIMKR